MFLFSLLYLCVLLSGLAKFQACGFIWFSFSSWTPVAQPLVGAAYQDQDSLAEQEGLKATLCVWRDKERDRDQQASCETGQHSPLAS